jgi:murein DD-endopeptidase MepM/ murein hydrolase activator NlpD
MDPVSLPQVPAADALLDGRLAEIGRLDARRGPAAAAQELQVEFLAQLIEALRRTVPENELLPRSSSTEVYEGLFDREMARVLATGDPLGLVAALARDGDPPAAAAEERERPPAAAGAAANLAGAAPWQAAGRVSYADPADLRGADAPRVVAPLAGTVSSAYGPRRHPLSGRRQVHEGMDLAAPAGTPVRAVTAGEVVFSGWAGRAGRRVVVEHAGGYRTVYAHAGRTLVAAGDAVAPGQAIATVGTSGRSTGPHVHFEVRRHGVALDPARAPLTAEALRRAGIAGGVQERGTSDR